jgi:hypothetical protein
MAADTRSLEEAVAALRRDPSRPVRAQVDELTVELRAVEAATTSKIGGPRTAGEALTGVRWHGDETLDELLAMFKEMRRQGGSGEVPEL